jgi:hypothetical protein
MDSGYREHPELLKEFQQVERDLAGFLEFDVGKDVLRRPIKVTTRTHGLISVYLRE